MTENLINKEKLETQIIYIETFKGHALRNVNASIHALGTSNVSIHALGTSIASIHAL